MVLNIYIVFVDVACSVGVEANVTPKSTDNAGTAVCVTFFAVGSYIIADPAIGVAVSSCIFNKYT